MKDITRIHIAKTAYDIELAAKKELEKYISGLEKYAEDQEILDDIEIRITELLAERKVDAGGVITKNDVEAVRERLGEPSDFAPENAESMTTDMVRPVEEGKRVYRDTDNALVGGVLAGIARYFGIDSLWVRLIFLVLFVASFGTAVILYVVLWLIVPPAKTATQKLQAVGKPVTLESLKSFSEDEKTNHAAELTRKFLQYVSGAALLVMGIGTLIGTGFISFGIFGFGYGGSSHVWSDELAVWWFAPAMTLFTIAGVLLAVLLFLLANSVFRKLWSKRTTVAVVSVIAAGLMTFATGIGFSMYGSWQQNNKMLESQVTSTINLPANFTKIKALTVDNNEDFNGNVQIQYIVSDKSYYELSSQPGTKPVFSISDDSKSATLKLTQQDKNENTWSYYGGAHLKVYGPALDNLTVHSGSVNYTNSNQQNKLTISGGQGSVSVDGAYEAVRVDSKDDLRVDLESATIKNLDVNLFGGAVSAGVVQTLAVSQPQACPANETNDNSVTVQSVSDGKIRYNDDIIVPANSINRDCGSVIVNKYKNVED